ncbi:MAG TPA: hypothetical protein VM097_03755 [Mycobacteriales bacterium]|nr:hypothetical protein [Mycobacteriales bacterium]
MRRLSAAVLLCAAACGGSALSPQEKTERCQDFAAAVAAGRLRTTPSEQVARDVAASLDNKLSRLGTPALHTPAVQVHQHLHRVEAAQRRGDAAAADRASADVRRAVSDLADACDLPEAAFFGD